MIVINSICFDHREPIGPGIYPLPQKIQGFSEILKIINNSTFKGKDETIMYIHIPFCRRFCSYCGIFKYPYQKEILDIYVEALCKEINSYKEIFQERLLACVYFGGGTATLLSKENWEDIFEEIRKFPKTNDCEITVEGTPDTFDKETLIFLKEQGVTRVSMGIQSFVRQVNSELNRFYNINNIEDIVLNALNFIGDINVDLIYNLPEQTRDDFIKDLYYISSLGITHLTINPFVVISTAPIYERIQKGLIEVPSEVNEILLFEDAIQVLKELDFVQYTVRDFCKSQRRVKYITMTGYCYNIIGIGMNSYGYLNGTAYQNQSNSMNKYLDAIKNAGFSFDKISKPNENDYLRKIMVQGLRLTDFSLTKSEILHQRPIAKIFKLQLDQLVNSGFIEIIDGIVNYSHDGLLYANNIRNTFTNGISYLGFGLSGIGGSGRGNY